MSLITNSQLLEEIKKLRNFVEASEVRILMEIKTKLTEKIITLEKENSILQEKVEILERQNKRNNIIIFGIKSSVPDILTRNICDKLNNLLNLKLTVDQINNIYCLGNVPQVPVKVEFISTNTKLQVLKNCSNLKGTNIIISHDLTTSQRETNNILRRHLKRVKSSANRCYIKDDKLLIDNEILSAEEVLAYEAAEVGGNTILYTNSAPGTPSVDIVENPPAPNLEKLKKGENSEVQTKQPSNSTPKAELQKNNSVKPRTRFGSTNNNKTFFLSLSLKT
ncbi:unnamed protein product [Psylliodes chrysocephalus]|uniref:Uncharacterized protein n=1 Tax=Psylliodes chrysocephalus TaxID=3402493 RepID=A0A9P0D1Q2_9CUCU|nr:unnamed protein product [Psylliodes chrysocephala]